MTNKGAPAPSASKHIISHGGGTRWCNNRSCAGVASSGRAHTQKKTIDLSGQMRDECPDAIKSKQHEHLSQGGVFDQPNRVCITYPGCQQNCWDTTHPSGVRCASAGTAATTTTAAKNVGAAAHARAASFAPASRLVSKVRRRHRFSAVDVQQVRLSSQQQGNVWLDFDAASSRPQETVRFYILLLTRSFFFFVRGEGIP